MKINNNMNADQKIDEVLKAMDNMQRAELSPFLKAKIINQFVQEEKYFPIPLKRSILIASFTLFLLAINLAIYYKSNISNRMENKSEEISINDFTQEYNFHSTTINYYNEKR